MGKNYFEMIRDGILVDGSGGGDAPAPVLITKQITANGEYSASDDSADGYSGVSVSVPNSYTTGDEGKVVYGGALVSQTSTTAMTNGTIDTTTNNSVTVSVPNTYGASDEGKVVQSGALVSQTATSTTTNGTIDTTTNNSVVVNVANSYVAADEGKVVSNGALVAQGSDSVTENGTVDTTLISSLLVNVSASGSVATKLTTTDTKITSSDIYIIEGTIYYYIFGYLYGSGSPSYAEFSIPSDFDTSNIGSTLGGVLFNITNPQSSYTMDNIYNNKIPIPFYSGKQSGIFIPFEKNS